MEKKEKGKKRERNGSTLGLLQNNSSTLLEAGKTKGVLPRILT